MHDSRKGQADGCQGTQDGTDDRNGLFCLFKPPGKEIHNVPQDKPDKDDPGIGEHADAEIRTVCRIVAEVDRG